MRRSRERSRRPPGSRRTCGIGSGGLGRGWLSEAAQEWLGARGRQSSTRAKVVNAETSIGPTKRTPQMWYRNFRWKTRSLYLVAAVMAIGCAFYWKLGGNALGVEGLTIIDGRFLNTELLNLPANRWIRIAPEPPALLRDNPFTAIQNFLPLPSEDWTRQGHSGLAFDSKRDRLLIFGSNSHGENWDNSVHEFNILTLKWTTHYPASSPKSYRADEMGYAVAGDTDIFPWAMHTFDNIVYAPPIDSLVVSSKIDHTPPPTAAAKEAHANPTWIYHLDSHEWKKLRQADGPAFFAAASTYDAATSSVWAFQYGQLWRLDLTRLEWRKIPASQSAKLHIHYTMVTDEWRHQFMFFGDHGGSNAIWVYTPAPDPDQEGTWEKRQPTGELCPKSQHFPVAYDSAQGVFLLVPDENNERAITLVYSPDDNRYIRVPGGEMPANHMNYMMAYDPYHRVMLLVKGTWKTPVTVWAFRLDMKSLARAQ